MFQGQGCTANEILFQPQEVECGRGDWHRRAAEGGLVPGEGVHSHRILEPGLQAFQRNGQFVGRHKG